MRPARALRHSAPGVGVRQHLRLRAAPLHRRKRLIRRAEESWRDRCRTLGRRAVPARIVSLTERGLVTDELKADLPPDELLDQVEFLTPAQIAAASEVLAENWGPMVADA